MVFSWAQQIKDAEIAKIKRARLQAKLGYSDFKLAHPAEVREAQNNKFTELDARIKRQCKQYQEMNILRRNKIGGN